jgi:hypothetical protein
MNPRLTEFRKPKKKESANYKERQGIAHYNWVEPGAVKNLLTQMVVLDQAQLFQRGCWQSGRQSVTQSEPTI